MSGTSLSMGVNIYTFVGVRAPTMLKWAPHNGSPGTHKDYHGTQSGFDRLGNPNSFDNV